jgi:hypothetical protein
MAASLVLQRCDYDIEFIGGIKNSILVVKDYFTLHFAVQEPFIQSLPFSRLANYRISTKLTGDNGEAKEAYRRMGGY